MRGQFQAQTLAKEGDRLQESPPFDGKLWPSTVEVSSVVVGLKGVCHVISTKLSPMVSVKEKDVEGGKGYDSRISEMHIGIKSVLATVGR